MMPILCLLCRNAHVDLQLMFCVQCRDSRPPEVLEQMAHDLQQYRMVIGHRFADTKRFYRELRLGATAAGFQPVVGPTAVRVVTQRHQYTGDTISAYRLVESTLNKIAFGPHTEIQSTSVTLIKSGNLLTVVEVRAMLDDELSGSAGVGR